MHINREIGDYQIKSAEANRAPFYVHKLGDGEPISEHDYVTAAMHAILRYQQGDERRARQR